MAKIKKLETTVDDRQSQARQPPRAGRATLGNVAVAVERRVIGQRREQGQPPPADRSDRPASATIPTPKSSSCTPWINTSAPAAACSPRAAKSWKCWPRSGLRQDRRSHSLAHGGHTMPQSMHAAEVASAQSASSRSMRSRRFTSEVASRAIRPATFFVGQTALARMPRPASIVLPVHLFFRPRSSAGTISNSTRRAPPPCCTLNHQSRPDSRRSPGASRER